MNPELIDPLGPKSAGIRYCSACDNNSATYAGKFLASPHNPEARRQWMVRIGVIKATDPFPGMKRVYVCDNHFDKQNDFITDRRYGPRLRQGTLPWRNLKPASTATMVWNWRHLRHANVIVAHAKTPRQLAMIVGWSWSKRMTLNQRWRRIPPESRCMRLSAVCAFKS
nr:uncharacterized protein LOC109425366 [Aedes albopictus]